MTGESMLEEARPFVKWAGGKRQLLEELTQGLPYFENYHEPFNRRRGALFQAGSDEQDKEGVS